MSRWIDADKRITVQLYDDMHEEWSVENMTIAEYLDRYTEEGCSSAGRPEGEWVNDIRYPGWTCTHCNYHYGNRTDNYCSNCGAMMKGGTENE